MPFPEKFPAKYPQLNEMEFTSAARDVLIRIIKVAFPHRNFPDGPYQRMADRIIELANESTWFRIKLLQGISTLNSLAGGDFVELDQNAAHQALKHVENTDFFGFIRRTTILEMYEDEEVWEALGYEGPSFDKGGYLHRGFDDLDWLPAPRVDEHPEMAQFEEIAPGLPGLAPAGAPGPSASVDDPTGRRSDAHPAGDATAAAPSTLKEEH